MLLSVLNNILAALLLPSICLLISLCTELKKTKAELKETQEQLQEARRKIENATKINQLLLDEKFARDRSKKNSNTEIPSFLTADDPMDAICRQVGVNRQ